MKLYIPVVASGLLQLLSVVVPVHNITLWPLVISQKPMSELDERHELVHVLQQLEIQTLGTLLCLVLWPAIGFWALVLAACGWLPFVGWFYLLYAGQYLWLRLRGHDARDAYYFNCFEAEAYAYNGDPENRKPFGWINFL